MTGQLMTLDETAKVTLLPVATLRYYRHLGTKGPQSFKIGRKVVYRAEDVHAWLDEQYAEAGHPKQDAAPPLTASRAADPAADPKQGAAPTLTAQARSRLPRGSAPAGGGHEAA